MSPSTLGAMVTLWKHIMYSNVIHFENVDLTSVTITNFTKTLNSGLINVFVSNEGGTASSYASCVWEQVNSEELNGGLPHTFTGTGKYLYYKIEFWGNTASVPEITEMKIKYN